MTKIECPFKLPLVAILYDGDMVALYETDKFTEEIGTVRRRSVAYIIRAVNSFEKMREALRPFAGFPLASLDQPVISTDTISYYALVSDLRHAAAVLKEIEDEG